MGAFVRRVLQSISGKI